MTKAPTLLEYLEKIGEIEWIHEVEFPAPVVWLRRYQILVAAAIAFFSQPLALWMFIPCSEDGKPMEKPIGWDYFARNGAEDAAKYFGNGNAVKMEACLAYQSALDRVVFEGWEYSHESLGAYFVLHRSNTVLRISQNKSRMLDSLMHAYQQEPLNPLQFTQSTKERLKIQE